MLPSLWFNLATVDNTSELRASGAVALVLR